MAWLEAGGGPLLVVGVGASASGVDAVCRLLRSVPPSSHIAFVLAQHLDLGHRGTLAGTLGNGIDLPVAIAEDGQQIEPGRVYIAPRGGTLLVECGRVRLVAAEARGTRQPIDALLTSLAEDQREGAVGIVLSGTGSDGALGMLAVRRRGGATFAQLPGEARFERAPEATATGRDEQTLPADQLPAVLVELAAGQRAKPNPGHAGAARSAGDLEQQIQGAQIAMVLLDRQLTIARFTPEAVPALRLADGDLGRPLAHLTARFDAEGLVQEVERVLTTLEPRERTVRTLDGTCWFLVRMHPCRTPSGAIAGVVISFLDVTKLKEVELELRTALGERERAEQALRDAAARKDEFLSVLSHELRNPLAPIHFGLHLLEHAPQDSERALHARQIIARQVGHLTRIVDDLLDVTRVEHGKLHVDLRPVDLSALVERTVEDHRSLFQARGLALDLASRQHPLWVQGDATRIAQMVGNLLLNAATFTPGGGAVHLSLDATEAVAELRVRDSGIGIDPAALPRLFQPYSQADAALDRSLGGLGLGLALVKGLVELHRGTIEASSRGKGAGAEFVVRLPISPAPPAATEAASPAPARPYRILVIEDNVDGAESLRQVLEREGHVAKVALDGRRGLALSREFRPEIVLCDIGLPGQDGYQVARALRSDRALGEPYLIAVTGCAGPENQQRAAAAGFDAHLAKPTTLAQIRRVIAQAGGERHPAEGPHPTAPAGAP